MPVKTWATNDVPTASDFNTQFRDQVISTVTSATRPTGTEGQHIYETDTDREYVHNGSGWIEWGGVGTWTSYTPTLTQFSAVTKTVTYAKYFKIGRMVTVNVSLAVTGTGTAGNAVIVSLPFTASAAGSGMAYGFVYDSSGNAVYCGIGENSTTTTMALYPTSIDTNAGNYLGGGGCPFTAALASGDQVRMYITYESAA